MNVALRRPMTLEEFLAWEREQELCYEFDGIQPIPMNGGTLRHFTISANILFALEARLREPWRLFGGGVKLLVAGRVRYPDAVVTCSPIEDTSDTVPDPVAVFEVLSSSTASQDRGPKAADYGATPSVQHYLILEQERPALVILSRAANWSEEPIAGLDATVGLPALGVELPMAELYRRVRLST